MATTGLLLLEGLRGVLERLVDGRNVLLNNKILVEEARLVLDILKDLVQDILAALLCLLDSDPSRLLAIKSCLLLTLLAPFKELSALAKVLFPSLVITSELVLRFLLCFKLSCPWVTRLKWISSCD